MEPSEKDFVPVAYFANEIEAELAEATLAAAGIESFLRDEGTGGMIPALQQTEGVALLVHKDRRAEAQTILITPATESPD